MSASLLLEFAAVTVIHYCDLVCRVTSRPAGNFSPLPRIPPPPPAGQYQLLGQYMGCNKGINSVTFDDEETLLLAAGNDFASRVWGVSDFRIRVSPATAGT